jgi:hypothetical protein
MDLKEAVELGQEHAVKYLAVLQGTLSRPGIELKLEDRDLVIFVVLSAILGITIGQLIPERKALPTLTGTTLVVLTSWVAFSFLTHGIYRAFGGKGLFGQTFRTLIRLFAALYVVINFATLVVMAAWVTYPQIQNIVAQRFDTSFFGDFSGPERVFFCLQSLLCLIYISLALIRTHNLKSVGCAFGGVVSVAVGIVATVIALVIGAAMFLLRGC